MEKKPRRKKRDSDSAVTAFRVVQEATQEPEPKEEKPVLVQGKNPHAVALGRLGGLKGDKARTAQLTPELRKEIAKTAAESRRSKPRTQ